MRITIPRSMIKLETAKAILVQEPNTEIGFFHPKRYCQSGFSGESVILWFGNTFMITLKKKGSDSEKKVRPEEFAEKHNLKLER